MKKCVDCDFWFNKECRGLLRDKEIVYIMVSGGYSSPDGIYTSEDFGCLLHSGYLNQQIKYLHESCGGLFTRKEIDGFEKPNGNTSFKICPKCKQWIEVNDFDLILVSYQ